MSDKFTSATRLNAPAAESWRASVDDALSEADARGAIVTVFYEDRTYKIRQLNVSQGDLALIAARLLRLAAEDE